MEPVLEPADGNQALYDKQIKEIESSIYNQKDKINFPNDMAHALVYQYSLVRFYKGLIKEYLKEDMKTKRKKS